LDILMLTGYKGVRVLLFCILESDKINFYAEAYT